VAKRHSKGEVEMTENPNGAAPVLNLRETRKQIAASKRAHPAGKQAAKKTPAKKAAKAPAKKAAPKPAAKAASTKVRWRRLEDKSGAVEQDATYGGVTWQIRRADGGWTVSQDGKKLNDKPIAYAAAGRLVLDHARKVA
jgi:hypothetical protein